MSISMSGSYISTPDTPSNVYPDRLIRPLPKRLLRDRLTPEAADSIKYPPSLPTSSLPTYNQYGDIVEYGNDSKVHVQQHDGAFDHDHDHDHDHHVHEHEHDHHSCLHSHDDEDDKLEGTEESDAVALRRSSGFQGSSRGSTGIRYSCNDSPTLDGYDAFENTNNKKKRKIPTSGNLGLHHATLSADLARLGLNGSGGSNTLDDSNGVGQYYGTGSAAISGGSGLSGAGRGRYGREAGRRNSGRNPLGVSTNGSNAWMSGKPGRDKPPMSTNDHKEEKKPGDQGIISAAIANATSLLRKPLQKGQENVSLLEQQPKASPTNSQFTFTCESDGTKGMTFPEQSLYAAGYPAKQASTSIPQHNASQKFSNQGTQTSPSTATQGVQQCQSASQSVTNQQNEAQIKKSRRRRGDVYALAARQRRLQQEYSNLHHPPAPEDIWICEFCEYESIFGAPPMALTRQYEIKDRKERRRLAEKRRLLEKAKMKGRKGRKQSKSAAKNASHNTQQATQQHYDQAPVDPGVAGQGEEYFDDEYDDDPVAMPAPPLQAPIKPPTPGPVSSGNHTGSGGGVG